MKIKSIIIGIVCISSISFSKSLEINDAKIRNYVKANYESSIMRKEIYNLEIKRSEFLKDVEENGSKQEKKVLSRVLDEYDPYEFSFTLVYEMYKQELKAVKEGW